MDEVRYWMMRPDQIVKRRNEKPVVYIPIGTLEWHGRHNPVGLDTLQVEALGILAAQKGGGCVFPPLYYGETRSESLMEANAADRDEIAWAMDLSPDNFLPDKQPFGVTEQVLNYSRLLLHILAEAESLGFVVGVILAGHYPLVDHARAAVLLHNQRRYSKYHGMLAWACDDYHLVSGKYDCAGDHAAGWETSHALHICPEAVDMNQLPPKGEKLVGVGGKMAPQDATSEFGRETLEAAADILVKEAHDRIDNTRRYRGHGNSLRERLWETESD